LAQPNNVSLRPRLVETELGLDPLNILRSHARVEFVRRYWTSWHQIDDGESKKGDSNEERNHLEQAAND